jgi:hypothetical protein
VTILLTIQPILLLVLSSKFRRLVRTVHAENPYVARGGLIGWTIYWAGCALYRKLNSSLHINARH